MKTYSELFSSVPLIAELQAEESGSFPITPLSGDSDR
jgi:hypothetical protein